VGVVFDNRLVGCCDIGSAATTSRVVSIMVMANAEPFVFVLFGCLSDVAISRVYVSGSTATGGMNMWFARVRAGEVRGGVAGMRAMDVADTTTATGVHCVLMGSDIFLNDLLLNGVGYGRLCRVARGRAKVAGTTTASREDLESRRWIGDHEYLK
jgi:hypothetical protein